MFLYIGSCRMSHSCDSPLTEDFYKNGKLQLFTCETLVTLKIGE